MKKTTTGDSTSLYPFGDDYEITDGVVTEYITVQGLGVIAKRVGSPPGVVTHWLHNDRLGSIQAVTDATGAVDYRRSYRPYGETLGEAGSPTESRGWIDQRNDPETGLTYLHARYYDPQLAVFLSPDRLQPTKPGVGTNRYAYAFGSPVNGTDRWGMEMRCASRISETMQGSQEWNIYYDQQGNPVMKELVYDNTQMVPVMTLECTYFENGPGEGFEFVKEERLIRENLFSQHLDPTPPVIDPNGGDAPSPPSPSDPNDGSRNARRPGVEGPGSHNPDPGWIHAFCKYSCKSDVPDFARPFIWVAMDSPWAVGEKALIIGAGNVAAQVGATGLEFFVLTPARAFRPELIGDPRYRDHTAWYVFQEGFNDVWTEFVFP